VDWIPLIYRRDQCRAVVNIILKFHIPHKLAFCDHLSDYLFLKDSASRSYIFIHFGVSIAQYCDRGTS
jgi:hypothetical protein